MPCEVMHRLCDKTIIIDKLAAISPYWLMSYVEAKPPRGKQSECRQAAPHTRLDHRDGSLSYRPRLGFGERGCLRFAPRCIQ